MRCRYWLLPSDRQILDDRNIELESDEWKRGCKAVRRAPRGFSAGIVGAQINIVDESS